MHGWGNNAMQWKTVSVKTTSEPVSFTAIIYRIGGPPDADADIVLPGAIQNGARVKVSLFNHDAQLLPLEPAGEAQIFERGDFAVAEGTTFDNPRGRMLAALLRAGGESVQWSVGYRVLA
ncbi:MAG: hypothetical protein KatS3mg081_0547 [Gemmatimonadales bacterium]|nr:MAG: hypothetical protein KatS3mg081_0547 [Gemmatimonadales bacterium]